MTYYENYRGYKMGNSIHPHKKIRVRSNDRKLPTFIYFDTVEQAKEWVDKQLDSSVMSASAKVEL